MGRRRRPITRELRPLPGGRLVEGPRADDDANIRHWLEAIRSKDNIFGALDGIRILKRWLELQEYRWVFTARREEVNWVMISMHLGGSRQAVWQRWAHRTP